MTHNKDAKSVIMFTIRVNVKHTDNDPKKKSDFYFINCDEKRLKRFAPPYSFVLICSVRSAFSRRYMILYTRVYSNYGNGFDGLGLNFRLTTRFLLKKKKTSNSSPTNTFEKRRAKI